MADLATGDVAGSMMGAATSYIAGGVVSAVDSLAGEVSDFLDTTTHPNPADPKFLQQGGVYQTVASFAVVLLIGFIFLQVIQGVLAGEPLQAVLRMGRDVPLTVLAIFGFPWLVARLVDVADGLQAAVMPTGHTLHDLLILNLVEQLKGQVTQNPIPSILLGCLTYLGFLLMYLELLVRVVILRLIEALAPLSLAPMVWAPARPAARKVAEAAAAAALSGPAVLLGVRVGLDLLMQQAFSMPGGAAWGKLLLGLAIVAVSVMSPWVIWRLLPHAEHMLLAQGLSRSPAKLVMPGMQTAYWAQALRSRAGRGAPSPRPSGPSSPSSPSGPGPARSLPTPTAAPRPRGPAGGPGAGAAAGATRAGGAAAAGGATAGVTVAASAARAGSDRAATSADQHTRAAQGAPARPGSGPAHPGAAGPGGPGAARGPGPGPGVAPGGGPSAGSGWSRRPPRRPGT